MGETISDISGWQNGEVGITADSLERGIDCKSGRSGKEVKIKREGALGRNTEDGKTGLRRVGCRTFGYSVYEIPNCGKETPIWRPETKKKKGSFRR